ncbi:hypothetical protein PYCC9005_003354 [Savitreella phatthalungensis]
MSDAGRKDFSTKAQEKLTPDSSKSLVDKAKEAITGASDKVAREGQSDKDKGFLQSTADKISRS